VKISEVVLLLFCGILLVNGHSTLAAVNHISPDHEFLQYTGRVDFSERTAPRLSWPGTYIKAQFLGSSVSVILDDQWGHNYFNVFIDGDWENPIIIDCDAGIRTYAVANRLSNTEHTLTIFKRTEGEEGNTVFRGLLIEDGGLSEPSPRPGKRIEFIGDSITSGAGNEAAENAPDDNPSEKNNFLAYGAITAWDLNAEYVSTSHSGIGIMGSWFDYTMWDYYDQLNATGNNDSHWDFNQWQPHIVVINLFQNDSWLVETKLQPVPNDEQRKQAYYEFVQAIRGTYPDAFIICALGSMDAVRPGSMWPEYISAVVDRVKKEAEDQRIETLFFDYDGLEKHPRVKHHRKNAAKLTTFIRAKMLW
jgi:hypothetical protein